MVVESEATLGAALVLAAEGRVVDVEVGPTVASMEVAKSNPTKPEEVAVDLA